MLRITRDQDYLDRFPYMKPTLTERTHSLISHITSQVNNKVFALTTAAFMASTGSTQPDSLLENYTPSISEYSARVMLMETDNDIPDDFHDAYKGLIEPFWYLLQAQHGISDIGAADFVEIYSFYKNPTKENLDWVLGMYPNPDLDKSIFDVFKDYHYRTYHAIGETAMYNSDNKI